MIVRILPARAVGTVILAALAATLGGCAAASVQRQASASQGPAQIGLTQFTAAKRPVAAPIAGATLTGTRFALRSTIGHVVVVNVWASWCGPCRAESPALARAAAAFAGRSVRFVGIDEQDVSGLARKFVAATGAAYPNLVDSDGQILGQLRLLPQAGVPSTLVLDRQGRIADRFIGPVTQAGITSLVTGLLKEKVKES